MSDQLGYLLVKGKAGLGNRILCALTAILYARLCDRRLVVDWSDFTYSNNGTNSFPSLFSLPESCKKLPLIANGSVRPKIWAGRLNMSAGDLVEEINPKAHTGLRVNRAFSVNPLRLDYEEQILVMWSYSQQISRLRRYFTGRFGWLAKINDEEIMSWLLRDVMILHPNIAADVDSWWDKNKSELPLVGVHLRLMDRRISLEHFYKAIDKLLSQVPNARIFLATDNPAAQRAMESRYPGVCSTKKWFPDGGISMHQNPECPDRLANAIEALRDMYILARCDYLVFPGSSTFSYISSLLSIAPRANIIDVERGNAVVRLKRFMRDKLS